MFQKFSFEKMFQKFSEVLIQKYVTVMFWKFLIGPYLGHLGGGTFPPFIPPPPPEGRGRHTIRDKNERKKEKGKKIGIKSNFCYQQYM